MMRQFDVVDNPDPLGAETRPYLLNLQSDLMHELMSTVVAPLVPRADMTGGRRLNPIVGVNRQEYWLATHELFAIDRRALSRSAATNLAHDRDAIIAALDLVFTGF